MTSYAYLRISRQSQSLERQRRNVLAYGDVIVFDSVSRMSRNAQEGVQEYMSLYERGVELVFIKEPHINTETYKQALGNNIALTG